MNQAVPSKKVRVGPLAVVLMVNALKDGAHTYTELAEASGLHHTTLRRWLAQFRKPTQGHVRLVHIADWEEDNQGRRNTPSFAWGNKRDAERRPLAQAERQARVRDRNRRSRQVKTLAALAATTATTGATA